MTAATATVAQPAPLPATRPTAQRSLVTRIAERFAVDPDKLMSTLKATAFRQRPDRKTGVAREPTNEEMFALLVIADQYRLNPFTRELFAFLDPKSGAIVPVVSVDGWIRIINEQPTLRSLSFVYSGDTTEHNGKTCHAWMECEIIRSDRDKPIVIREYFDEVVRKVDFATPWDSHPNRMHRHKTLIQTARVAFGFGGIYDEDEAQRIIEGQSTVVSETSPAIANINAQVTGKPPTAAVASTQNTGDLLTDFVRRVGAATDDNALDVLVDESRGFVGKGLTEEQHNDIVDIAAQRSAELGGAFADSDTPAA